MIYILMLVTSLGIAVVESVSYLGFFFKHTGIPAYLVYLVGIIAVTYVHKPIKLLVALLGLFSVLVSLLFFVLSFAEIAHYPNYVFTVTHINLVSLQFLIGLLFLHYFAYKDWLSKPLDRIAKGLLVGILVCIGADGLGRTISFANNNIKYIKIDPFATYEQKMIKAYPGLYPALKEVVRLTPEDAIILIPPQGNPWEFEGNGAIVTYFIYPRRVKNIGADGIFTSNSEPTYALIAKGSWPTLTNPLGFGWPKVVIPAARIWQFDLANQNTIEYNRDFNPETDQWDWGLIEVKHE